MHIRYSQSKQVDTNQLERLFHSVDWKSGQYPNELQAAIRQSHSVLTAWADEQLVGLINTLSDGCMTVYFHYVLVHPEYQSRGIGRSLVEQMLERYKNYKTILLVSYEETEAFYERIGFKTQSETKAMYITELL